MQERKAIKPLKLFSNIFINKDEELAFEKHYSTFKNYLSIIIPIIGCVLSLVEIIIQIKGEEQPVNGEPLKSIIAAPLFLTGIALGIQFFIKKLYKYTQYLILFWAFGFLVYLLIQDWEIYYHLSGCMMMSFIMIGFSIQIMCSILSISKISWQQIVLLQLAMFIALCFKIAYQIKRHMNMMEMFIPHYAYYCVLLVINIILTYWLERNTKNQFHLSQKYEKQLNNFKDLLQKTITTPTIIISDVTKNIIIANDATYSLFLNIRPNYLSLQQFEDSSENHLLPQISNLQSIINSLRFKRSQIYSTEEVLDIPGEQQLDFYRFLEESHQKIFDKKEKIHAKGTCTSTVGKTLYLDCQFVYCEWEGEKATSVCINDVTIFQESENFKDKILATISHNLRTPVMNIKAEIENALSVKTIDNDTKNKLRLAECSTNILLAWINSMLDFSLLCRDCVKIDKNWITFGSLLTPIINCFQLQCQMKGLQFEFANNIRFKDWVKIDYRRVTQILMKLLTNSIKQTSDGYIKLIVTIKLQTNELQFLVEDSGLGIRPEDIKKIFKFSFLERKGASLHENFEQGIGGVNMGLQICNELVKIMEKTENQAPKGIKVFSEYKKGSIFSFSIYFGQDGLKNLKEFPQEEDKEQTLTFDKKKSFENKVVLIVDDDPFCLNIVCSFAKDLGFFKIEKARNGIECLKIIEKYRMESNIIFDLIILDCDMPEMDGLEASRKICQMIGSGFLPAIPIMALTANISTADQDLCKQAGMGFYLSKPVSKEQFGRKLCEILKIEYELNFLQ